MKVTEIRVTAARTFNHPHESYSNLRPAVSLTATIDESEDATVAAKALQAKAEQLVEDHKNALLSSLDQLYEMTQVDSEVASLERQLASAQSRLEQLRATRKELPMAHAAVKDEAPF